MLPMDAEHLLAVWEQGARRHPVDRALLLLSLTPTASAQPSLADLPLGDRNAALLALREQWFGAELELFVDCAACGERMTLRLDRSHFPELPEPATSAVWVAGQCFRRPTSRDLIVAMEASDATDAARALLRACAEQPDHLPTEDQALDALLEGVETEMDRFDPWADLCLLAPCPACGVEQDTTFDIGEILWKELERVSSTLLDDIHLLASAYGWNEREILSLSDARRAAYIERLRQ